MTFEGLCTPGHTTGNQHIVQFQWNSPVIINFGTLLYSFCVYHIYRDSSCTGHIVYMLRSDPPCLFTGDLIFVCGNGKVIENAVNHWSCDCHMMTHHPLCRKDVRGQSRGHVGFNTANHGTTEEFFTFSRY